MSENEMNELAASDKSIVLSFWEDNELLAASTASVLTLAEWHELQQKLQKATPGAALKGEAGLLKSSVVHANARRRGIGALMIDERLKFLTGRGCEVALAVSWKNSPEASSLGPLQRAGFRTLAEIPNYWAEVVASSNSNCPVCGARCECTATVMYKEL